MLLSGKLIEKLIRGGHIIIKPEPIIKEAAVKIHFSGLFGQTADFLEEKEKYVLKPKEFVLAKSLEKITLSADYAGLYDTYVGLARQGIITHMGSVLVDPGYSGHIQLEVFNCSDREIVLKKGLRAGHLIITEVKN